ncbi:MAG: hypothetical protein H7177_01245 [Rhizobacter sp.]|nr:hypothetical protein [Bacteriovorax sp.]
MKSFTSEKTDVVSVILEDCDLLDTFADALEIPKHPVEEEFSFDNISATSIGFLQKSKCYIWSLLKKVLKALSMKAQILAVLAEYHSNHEEKKVQAILTKEKV